MQNADREEQFLWDCVAVGWLALAVLCSPLGGSVPLKSNLAKKKKKSEQKETFTSQLPLAGPPLSQGAFCAPFTFCFEF